MPTPQTQVHLNGYRVDFCWPELGLVVETDGLTTTARPHNRPRTSAATRRTWRPA
jgi:very-short-patch-repair endonuclease